MYVKKINHFEQYDTTKIQDELLKNMHLLKQNSAGDFLKNEITINVVVIMELLERLELITHDDKDFIRRELNKATALVKSIHSKIDLIPNNYKEDSSRYSTYRFLICDINDKITESYHIINTLIPYC
ncbi:hypothetical protein [Vallitalea okinawensis]|uniref:hypothetical protein n=1 Tax=Vallitalea okinawensis TaxID=2078660 RepID=UPI000CFC291B|nr:hypothetical protein [Vallitalea okinawensis]